MKYQEKIRIFSPKQENQDISKKSGKHQESSIAARPEHGFHEERRRIRAFY
jgi:hypothetical protein